ncbi:hypothetical protein EDI_084120 [Entamoeba dispar SAW760]|uniref:Uncharacterized protein n=1 Tax=Entamoeba dispar (strain ATCC PRA-260 / SAW760) TaxID=370354 RepID=B0EQV0_ENTDS|nr:uncharacterized protein EDI_084120 [Entamoeba dispar SAW760]EDR23092.1 hypothetical protein EDI_084120 [Entamoeba dispar SAW760]|eukprot:EDR23092.1 hypothetical protein EDI_084120 [Entamoeba dispar SAW760]
MFSWFFRKSTPVELRTAFVDDHTWVAELNSGDQLQTVKELFASTFDSDNFVVIDEDKSVTALLSGDERCQCTLTFGYNGDNRRIAVISYIDSEDEDIVKPTINAFALEMENYSLLFEQPIKEQKPIENCMVPMKEVIYERDIIIDEDGSSISVMLRENVDLKKMLSKIGKLAKDKYLLEAKTGNGKLEFCEKGNETFKIIVQIGRNNDKQRVMALTASEKRVYWKEFTEAIVSLLMKGKCLSSYAVTATLRKNLRNTAKPITNATEDKQPKEEKKEEVHINIETTPKEEKKEEVKEEKKEEVKEEKKEEVVQIPIEQK